MLTTAIKEIRLNEKESLCFADFRIRKLSVVLRLVCDCFMGNTIFGLFDVDTQ